MGKFEEHIFTSWTWQYISVVLPFTCEWHRSYCLAHKVSRYYPLSPFSKNFFFF